MPTSIALGTYNPSQVPRETLLAEFTARLPMLSDLLGILRANAPGEPCQHSLLIGPRGFGKTTSLFALKYRVEDDAALAATWTPLLFDEENYQIGDLAGFWLECLRLAETTFQIFAGARYATLSVSRDPKLETLAREAFLSVLDQQQRRALLLIDNINDILAVVSDELEQHRLRAFLLEDSRVCIVGTASTYFEAIQNTDQPFYNLFRPFRLDRFTPAEMRTAVEAMADARAAGGPPIELPTAAGYWKGLHILTGGNPRLVKMVFQLMEQGVTPDFRTQLEGLLDAYTPYFKHRIESMSPQQRRVFDAIALAWDPVEISDIAPGLRLESNQISAQIRALTDAQFVAIAGGSAKRRRYQIADRFSNIYYFMRYSRAGRSRFEWFVRTMKAILTPEQFLSQLDRMRSRGLACANDSELRDQAHLLVSATHALDDLQLRRSEAHKSVAAFLTHKQEKALDHLLNDPEMRDVLADEHDAVRFFASLPPENRENIGYQPQNGDWWYQLTDFAEARSLWQLAEAAYHKAIKLDPADALSWNGLGILLATHLPHYEEAEKAFLKAIALDPFFAYPWNNLGILFVEHLRRFDEGEAAYRRAIELDPSYPLPWNGLGNLLVKHFRRFDEAETAYRKAIELDPSYAYPWNGLGALFERLQRFDEAGTAYRKAIALDPSDAYPWNNLGNLFANRLGRFDEAGAAYREAIKLDPAFSFPWNGLGNLLYSHFQRFDEAIEAYRKAIVLDPSSAEPWNGLGNLLYSHFQRFDEAIEAYRKAIALDPFSAHPKSGLANVLFQLKQRSSEAIDLATEAILLAPEAAWPQSVFREVALSNPPSSARVLPRLAEVLTGGSLNNADNETADQLYALALDCVVTLLRAGQDNEALALIDRPETRDLFDVPIRAIEVRRDPMAKTRLATERLALVEAFLEKVSKPPEENGKRN